MNKLIIGCALALLAVQAGTTILVLKKVEHVRAHVVNAREESFGEYKQLISRVCLRDSTR